MEIYDNVVDTLDENSLSWNDVDRILLHEDNYFTFHGQSHFDASNHSTTDVPAVRQTTRQEKIVHIDNDGRLKEIEL